MDYLANPSIVHKHFVAIKKLKNYLYKTKTLSPRFDELKTQMGRLKEECYALTLNETAAEREACRRVEALFNEEKKRLADKELRIRVAPNDRPSRYLREFKNGVPKLDQLYMRNSNHNLSPQGQAQIKGSPSDQAQFLYYYAMEYNAIVLTSLRHLLKGMDLKYRGGIKSGLVRIAQKIEEDGSPYGITDMIRATVYCNSIEQLWDVYKFLDQNPLG